MVCIHNNSQEFALNYKTWEMWLKGYFSLHPHTYTYTHTYTHSHTHTHIHSLTHTHTHLDLDLEREPSSRMMPFYHKSGRLS